MQQLNIFMIFISIYNSLCYVNKYLKNLGTSTQQEGVKFHKKEMKHVSKKKKKNLGCSIASVFSP